MGEDDELHGVRPPRGHEGVCGLDVREVRVDQEEGGGVSEHMAGVGLLADHQQATSELRQSDFSCSLPPPPSPSPFSPSLPHPPWVAIYAPCTFSSIRFKA